MKNPFPRAAWADVDTSAKQTPVVIYDNKIEQRTCRPDLAPIRVGIISLAASPSEIHAAVARLIQKERLRRGSVILREPWEPLPAKEGEVVA